MLKTRTGLMKYQLAEYKKAETRKCRMETGGFALNYELQMKRLERIAKIYI
jgi:hypothetical protein